MKYQFVYGTTFLFIVQLGPRSKQSLSLKLRPRMNTKVAFNHHHHTKLLTSSNHSRRLKLGIKVNQNKTNANSMKKSLKKILKKVLKDLSFKLNTIASMLVNIC